MTPKKGSGMTTIKIEVTTQRRLREFVQGIGGTYDSVLNFLIDRLKSDDEPDVITGAKLRNELKPKTDEDPEQAS